MGRLGRAWLAGAAMVMSAMLCGLSTTVLAQSTTGTIQGVVRDDQGGVVPGATVTVRNVGTGQSRTQASDDQGQYRFPNLQVGEYELTVELGGFGTYKQSGLNLTLNQDAVIDVTLRPASLSESVQVRPPGMARASYRAISESPVSAGAVQDTVALSP